MTALSVVVFLVLMLGVALGSAAAAWALRLTAQEQAAMTLWESYRDQTQPSDRS